MGVVKIRGTDFTIIGDVDDADTVLLSVIGKEAWECLDPDLKDRALKTATDVLKSYYACLGGDISDEIALPTADQSVTLRNAAYEMAFQLTTEAGQQTILVAATTVDNLKSAKAGSAEVEFFRNTDSSRFPAAVQNLVNEYAMEAGITSASIFTGLVFGTDNKSSFDDADKFGREEGF